MIEGQTDIDAVNSCVKCKNTCSETVLSHQQIHNMQSEEQEICMIETPADKNPNRNMYEDLKQSVSTIKERT
jgi:hypothetical protein